MSLGKLVGTAVVGTALVVGATGCAEDVFRIGTVTRNSFQIPSTNSHCKRYAFEMKGDIPKGEYKVIFGDCNNKKTQYKQGERVSVYGQRIGSVIKTSSILLNNPYSITKIK